VHHDHKKTPNIKYKQFEIKRRPVLGKTSFHTPSVDQFRYSLDYYKFGS